MPDIPNSIPSSTQGDQSKFPRPSTILKDMEWQWRRIRQNMKRYSPGKEIDVFLISQSLRDSIEFARFGDLADVDEATSFMGVPLKTYKNIQERDDLIGEFNRKGMRVMTVDISVGIVCCEGKMTDWQYADQQDWLD